MGYSLSIVLMGTIRGTRKPGPPAVPRRPYPNTPISSDPLPSPTPSRITKSPNPRKLVLMSEPTSFQDPPSKEDDTGQTVNLNEPPVSTNQDMTAIEKPKEVEGPYSPGQYDVRKDQVEIMRVVLGYTRLRL
ncbi:hypothetical protein HAX54_015367 [Datura stramonium]|uniref:Uncharacterized protein n=1 Tax=Datura stramonium TaxID=4076 RepID=A0ABS8RZD7_DATST|nr:hypothetical protein [Datura stramonium]